MKTFKLTVSTPLGNEFQGEIMELSLRGTEGSLAVRAGHIPFMTATRAGEIRITDAEANDIIAEASDGLLTVSREETTLLLGEFKIN